VQLLDNFVRDCALEGIRVGDATSSPTVVIKKAVLVGNVGGVKHFV
jgi:hypothetical protein